jgi:hypothetical protein
VATPIISSAVQAVLDRASDEVRQAFADAVDAHQRFAASHDPSLSDREKFPMRRAAVNDLRQAVAVLAAYDWELPQEAARVAKAGAR